MRKVVLAMMTTLNGRLDDPGKWVDSISDDLYSDLDHIYERFDTLLVGRTTYAELVGYWPGAETDENEGPIVKSMARKMNTYKKFVFSKAATSEPLGWNNVERVITPSDADLLATVNTLKNQSGSDIHIVGGAQFAQAIIRLGVVDEYHFSVYPVVSAGAAWFDTLVDKRELQLTSSKAYSSGVVGLHYTPKV